MNEREAEDLAYDLWRAGTMGSEACSLNQEAWRAGFRLGREGKCGPVRDEAYAAGHRKALEQHGLMTTAPADSELGIELSKIRDRLNALENSVSWLRTCVAELSAENKATDRLNSNFNRRLEDH